MSELDAEWAAPQQLLARGRTSNPMQSAGRVIDHADAHRDMAVLVINDKDQWALLVSTNDRVLLVDGRKSPVAFTTHRCDGVLTPLMLASNPETRQRTRVSTPPFGKPGEAEFQVIAAVPIDQLPVPAPVRVALIPRAHWRGPAGSRLSEQDAKIDP